MKDKEEVERMISTLRAEPSAEAQAFYDSVKPAAPTDPVVSAEFRTRLTIFNADVHVSFHIKTDGSGQARLVVMPLDRVGGATYNMPANVQKMILHEISYRFMSYEGQEEASFDGIKEWLDSYDQLEKLQ